MFKVDMRLKGRSSICYKFISSRSDPALCPHRTGLATFGVRVLLLQLAAPFGGELLQPAWDVFCFLALCRNWGAILSAVCEGLICRKKADAGGTLTS